MLGCKLGYRPSVLLENAVGLDDERHAGRPIGGNEGPSNIISISHVEEQGSQPERSRGRLYLFPFRRGGRVAQRPACPTNG